MNVECRLRDLRGRVSLKEMERLTGINRGALSRYERGREFPPEHQIKTLERHYGGAYATWYPKTAVPAVRPHRERKPPSGIRITFRRDELRILRDLLRDASYSPLAPEFAIVRRLTLKIARARDRVEAA